MLFNLFNKKEKTDGHSNEEEVSFLIPLIGGRENIVKINNCATRLRLVLKDVNKINTEEIKKYYPAVQKIDDKEVHIIVGTKADFLAEELKNLVSNNTSDCNKALLILPLLGGIDNITKVGYCATRLRLQVKDADKVNTEEIKKYYPALEKINNNEVHIVVGTDANLLADEFKKFVI